MLGWPRVRAVIAIVVVAAGCYKPAPAPGAPCSPNLECPGDQMCDTMQNPPVCGERSDAGTPPDGVVACNAGCPASSPICDTATQTCRGCIADAECPSDVCHEFAGTCVAETAALYAASGGTGNCTRSQPCSLDQAISSTSGQRRVIKLADGAYGRIKIDNSDVVLSGSDRDPGGVVVTSGVTAIQIRGGTAIVEGLTVQTADGDGIFADADVTVFRVDVLGSKNAGIRNQDKLELIASRVANGNNSGVLAQGATSTTIERSTILKNPGGGVVIDAGTVSITNSLIAANGTAISQFGGVGFQPLGPIQQVTFRFNTVASNRGGLFGGINCSMQTTIDSSIVSDNDVSPLCNPTFSLFTGNLPGGLGNLLGVPQFVLPGTDFHILGTSPARGAANPAATETIDLDGDPRPQGGQRDIGADEIP